MHASNTDDWQGNAVNTISRGPGRPRKRGLSGHEIIEADNATLRAFTLGGHNPAFSSAGDNHCGLYRGDIVRTYSSYPPCPMSGPCDKRLLLLKNQYY